jgi:RNA polymerase sigma-70 factor (ECF subfamily)
MNKPGRSGERNPPAVENKFSKPSCSLYPILGREYCVKQMNDALEHWFAREILSHEQSLMRYLLRVWPNRDDVPDLRQEIYVRVFESAQNVRPDFPKSFLFTTARHLMTDRLRRSRIIFIGARGDLDKLNVLVDELSPEHHMTSLQELQLMAQAFDGLPPQCRTVMWLRKVEQLSQKEVAARLGVQEKAVEKQVARGMRLLTAAVLAGNDNAAADLYEGPELSEGGIEHG